MAFEIFIPLVLFFILLGLRQKKPAMAVKEGRVERFLKLLNTSPKAGFSEKTVKL